MLSNLSHPAYFAGTVNSTVIAFIFVVLPGDNTSLLTYSDTFSLRTLTSCALMDTVLNSCAAQNLPPPFSSSLNAMDLLSPLMMKILPYEGSFSSTMNLAPSLSSIPVIVNIEFVYPSSWQSFFTTGDLLQVLVTFSDAVAVIGTPYLQLFMDDMPLNLFFRDQPTRLALAFAYPIQSASLFGELLCSNLSSIILNGGRIVSAFNFIAIQDADIRIQPVCCATGICSLSSNILTEALIALRVYAGQSGVYSFPSSIDIYIDFNRPVVVIGQPVLLLSLPTNGTAVYIQNVNSNTLHFVYDLLPEDFTSDLDYASYPSLYCNEDDEGQCGIQLADTFYAFPASFLLPHSGEAGSLGRQSDVVIAMNIPILLTLNVTPSIAVLGDVIYFTFIYSDNLIGALSNNNSILPASANLSSYLSLAFAVVPSLEINSTFPFLNNETVAPAFTASFDSLANNSIVFSYEVSLEDPNGFVVFVSSAPIQYMEGIELVSYKYLTQASNILPATLVNQPLATIDNIVPYVILVDSPTVESSSFPFGVGSTLVILVHFSAPVVSFDTPVLRLRFSDGRTALAYGVGINSTSPTYAVQFDYIIDVGDNANPLGTVLVVKL